MFTSLRLRNFKGYADSGRVDLSPLTVVVGANNAGKSSLLHAILLLAQTLDDTASKTALVTSGPFVDLGGYFDILRGGRESGAEAFSIELETDPALLQRSFIRGPGGLNKMFVRFTLDDSTKNIAVSRCTIGAPPRGVDVSRSGRGYKVLGLEPAIASKLRVGFRHFLPDLMPKKRGMWSEISEPVRERIFFSDEVAMIWAREIGRVAHVAPLRTPVPRVGILGKSATSELGPGGENLLRALQSREPVDGGSRTLVQLVSNWVSSEFHMLDKLHVESVDPNATVLALRGDENDGFSNINVANMGEGISQVLPIIARVLTTPPRGTLLIEQPEIHLHPSAQADLADLFVDSAATGSRQYVIETHSEHLLLRLRRRIAEGKIDPDLVSVLYVERSSGAPTVRRLNLTESGEFEEWPKGFFDEQYQEALAILKASSGSR